MKKFSLFLILIMLLSILVIPASAAESGMAYEFSLSANGQETLEANCGDIITVALKLNRTDAKEMYDMYGMQSELRYDGTCLELVPNSATTYEGVATADVELADGYRELYMNYLSFSGGTKWEPEVLVGTVQFKVIGTTGVTRITNEDYLISLPDGTGSYECTSNEIFIVLSTACEVTFQSNGGTAVESQNGVFGEKIVKPEDPVREGYQFRGWYQDIHLTEEWNFDTDTVQSNMTLYAKWEKADSLQTQPTEPTVPTDSGVNDPPNLDWLWWIFLLLILLLILLLVVAVWLYRKNRRNKHSNMR